jgi:hypothetical protein
MRKWVTKDEHRMVLRNFSPPSVIMCHHSIGAVAYVGRSVLLKVKGVKCTKKDPAHTANTDEYPECVETTPRVFGPVTLQMVPGCRQRLSRMSA